MTTAGRAYVVRDADGGSGEVTNVYAYTLKGLTSALEDARFRSFHGVPQAVVVMRNGQSAVIRRFEQGREVPLPPLRPPATGPGLPSGRSSPDCPIMTECLWESGGHRPRACVPFRRILCTRSTRPTWRRCRDERPPRERSGGRAGDHGDYRRP
jgi:hypothetical protein